MNACKSIAELPRELQEEAEQELGEHVATRDAAIKALRDKAKETGVKLLREDDAFLLLFLRARRFDMDRALTVLKNYHEYRETYHAELFADFGDDELAEFLQLQCQFLLPQRGVKGGLVMVLLAGKLDIGNVSIQKVLRAGLFMCEKMVADAATQVTGLTVLVDMKGFALKTLTAPSAAERKLAAKWLNNCMPCRIRAVHVIHQPWYMYLVWNIIRPLFSIRLQAKIQLHGNKTDKILNDVSLQALPKEFGGDLDTSQMDFLSVFHDIKC